MNIRMIWMNKMIKALVFDLDDTLYDNTNYWLGAFKDISFYLEKEYGVEKNETYSILFKIFNIIGSGKILIFK